MHDLLFCNRADDYAARRAAPRSEHLALARQAVERGVRPC